MIFFCSILDRNYSNLKNTSRSFNILFSKNIQTDCGICPASYSVGTRGFTGDKATGECSLTLISI
jgi:hypothetical protein